MWHDNETTIDYLNFGVVADACAKLLQQANGLPLSVGVSGGWGVGKSSLVRMVAERLNAGARPEDNIYVMVTVAKRPRRAATSFRSHLASGGVRRRTTAVS